MFAPVLATARVRSASAAGPESRSALPQTGAPDRSPPPPRQCEQPGPCSNADGASVWVERRGPSSAIHRTCPCQVSGSDLPGGGTALSRDHSRAAAPYAWLHQQTRSGKCLASPSSSSPLAPLARGTPALPVLPSLLPNWRDRGAGRQVCLLALSRSAAGPTPPDGAGQLADPPARETP